MWGSSDKKINSESGGLRGEETKDLKDVKVIQKEFLAAMSYDIRDPLNAICGISDIALKNLETGGDTQMLKSYLEIIRDSAYELQDVINSRFTKFEEETAAPIAEFSVNGKDVSGSRQDEYKILNNLRVLIIEDSEVSRLIAKELLSDHGAIVTLCESGEKGVEKFKSSITGTYDVIFMDIKMPGIDGYEATARIRSCAHPQAKHIPIIAMTAEAFIEDIKNAMKAGMDAHVAKPINLDKMVAAIKKSARH